MKKNHHFFALLAIISVCVIGGCGRGSDDDSQSNPAGRAQSQVEGTQTKQSKNNAPSFLVKVGDKVLNKSDVEAEQQLRCALEKIRRPKIQIAYLEKIKERISATSVKYFISSSLFQFYCQENSLNIDSGCRRRYEQKVARSYKVKDIATLKKKIPGNLQYLFDEGIERSLVIDLAKSHILKTADISVSDKEVNDAISRYEKINQTASLTNSIVYAHASNVWQRITAKELTFKEAAYDYSEIADEAAVYGLWGGFKVTQFDDEEERAFRSWLATAPVGTFSPPMVVDGGLCIVKIDSLTKGNVPEQDEFTISRIYFRLPVIWDIPDKKELARVITEAKEKRAIESALSEVAKRHKVIYPK